MKQKAYIFDIDETLSDCSHRLHFITGDNKDWDSFYATCVDDTPIYDVVALLRALDALDIKIIFVTGRLEQCRFDTENWLQKYTGVWAGRNNMFMRKDGDHRPDYQVKREIYERKIKDKYEILGIFEDRQQCVDMWRSLGLTCFQVANGNY